MPNAAMRSRGRDLLFAIPWILILVITGSVQVLRGDANIDAVVFFVIALLLVLDSLGIGRVTATRPDVSMRVVCIVAACVAVVVTFAPRHGIVSTLVVAAVGVVTIGLTWLDPRSRVRDDDPDAVVPRSVSLAAACWAVVLVSLCLIELYSYLVGRGTDETQYAHPAISDLLDPLLDTPVGRVVFAVAWTATGVLLVTRGRKRHA